MHQRVHQDDYHLVSAKTGRKDEVKDLWEFHDPGDHSRVGKILTLCLYAASPSTREVIFFCRQHEAYSHLLYPVEVRVYGGEGRFVWLEIPERTLAAENKMLAGLAVQMEKAGKLTTIC